MNPDSAGLLEIGYDKIYPKGNILEKLVFKSFAGREQFIGEEHFNSATRHTPIDIDTALFRELSKYTKEFALRIAAALKSYRSSVFQTFRSWNHSLTSMAERHSLYQVLGQGE